jgi:RNA polymerase sigma factor (sigma-70 family)
VGAEQTVAVVTHDDVDAFCRAQYPRLVGLLGLYCGDGNVAEDLAQEALLRLVQKWSRLPTTDDAQRWLTRVALNLAKSSLRTRATRRRILDHYGAGLASESHRADPTSAVAVRAAVASLPERERRVVILRYFDDLSVAEVAEVMQCPEGSVKSLSHAAIGRLRAAGLEVNDD